MPRRPARVRQADIARAIRAVEQAGAGARMAVEIAPDGTIRLVPVEPDESRRNSPKCGVEAEREIML